MSQVRLHVFLDILLVVSLLDDQHRGACNGASNVGGDDLDANGALKGLVVQVLALDPHLPVGRRREQGADLGHHRPLHRGHDDGVALAKRAVDEDDVDGVAKALHHLDLEDGALRSEARVSE